MLTVSAQILLKILEVAKSLSSIPQQTWVETFQTWQLEEMDQYGPSLPTQLIRRVVVMFNIIFQENGKP